MRGRLLFAAVVLALATVAALRFGRARAPDVSPTQDRASAPGWDAARWHPGDAVPNVELLALDGLTVVHLLDRGANRPLILILAATGSPALDRCASRWRELFEIYKDRVEFLTVFVAAPDSGGAVPAAGVPPDMAAAADPQNVAALRRRIGAAMTFAQCNDWRIPVLLDGPGGAAAAAFGTAPQVAVLMDEGRRRLGAPVAAEGPADLDPVNAWLRHRFAP